MKIVLFSLHGELALWRNVYDSIGSYSCLGPAPSALAGFCGAALGFASPRSQGATAPDANKLQAQWEAGFPWPVAPELLTWLKTYEVAFACRWTGRKVPKRISWNVIAWKYVTGETDKGSTYQMQQQMIDAPCYEVAVRLASDAAAEELAQALRTPAFRLYLGCSECPAYVTAIRLADELPTSCDWAFRAEQGMLGESTPLSVLRLDAETSHERLQINGYWVYPTPNMPGCKEDNPFVLGYEA